MSWPAQVNGMAADLDEVIDMTEGGGGWRWVIVWPAHFFFFFLVCLAFVKCDSL